MSKRPWLTPEEAMKMKARKKKLLYVSLILIASILSALVTILVNEV